MKNLYDLLRQKELAMKRLEKEIEAIRIVISMLSEDGEQPDAADIKQAFAATTAAINASPAAGGTYSAVNQNAPAGTPKGRQPLLQLATDGLAHAQFLHEIACSF